MNMAMYDQTQLPTPYPMALGGVTDWLNAPFDWAASLFVATPNVVGITPQTQAAIAQGFTRNQAAIAAKSPATAATIRSAIQAGNWESASRNLSIGNAVVAGNFDKAIERERMRMSSGPADVMNPASLWILNNWPWIVLVGGGALLVNQLRSK